jgi:hypothetical protein
LEFILQDSGTQVCFVDAVFAPLVDRVRTSTSIEKVVLIGSGDVPHDLTYDDVFLVPGRSSVRARFVLVNPAVEPYKGLRGYLGPQKNLYTGAVYELTPEHLAELEILDVDRPTRLVRYYLMVTTGDEVLDYREAVTRFVGAKQLVVQGSDHGFADFGTYLDTVLEFAGIA